MKPAGLVLVTLVLWSVPAAAQVTFGAQGSYGDDSDFGVGARVVFPIGEDLDQPSESIFSQLRLTGSFDWFFPDCGDGGTFDGTEFEIDCTYWELNGNGILPLNFGESIDPYVGAGLNVAHGSASSSVSGFEAEFSDTEMGLNLLGGLEFGPSGLPLFAELRIELGGGEQFVLTLGALFGGS